MRPIKLITDSTSDLSTEIVQQYAVSIIPLYVNFSVQSYRDNIDITPPALFREVKETGRLPMTSAPTVQDFAAEFQKYFDQSLDILHISISSKISASYQNACTAAAQFPEGRIQVIDSLNLSSGIGILVMQADLCLQQGMNLPDTVREVQSAVPRVRTKFIIDTAEYLHKGGRCSGLQMLLSSLLEIHPIIAVSEGAMHLAAKVRGNRQLVLRSLVKGVLDNPGSIDPENIFITHSESSDDADRVKTQLAALGRFKQILVTNASCVIASHCGPKTIGIIYLQN